MSDLTPPPPAAGAADPNRPYTPPTAAPLPAYPSPGPQPTQPYPGAAPSYPSAYPEYPPAGYPYAPYPSYPPRTNTLAVVGFVLSILGFIWVLPFIGGLVGAIMGHAALGQIRQRNEGGRGLALAAVIIGWIAVGIIVVGVLLLFAVGVAATSSGYSLS